MFFIASLIAAFANRTNSLNYFTYIIEVAGITVGLCVLYKFGKVLTDILKLHERKEDWKYWLIITVTCIIITILALLFVPNESVSNSSIIEQYYNEHVVNANG